MDRFRKLGWIQNFSCGIKFLLSSSVSTPPGSQIPKVDLCNSTILFYGGWYKICKRGVRIPDMRHADVVHENDSRSAGHKLYRHVMMTAPCTHLDHRKYHRMLLVMDMTPSHTWVIMTKLVRHVC